ncbi:MAG: hypothetical protein HRU13_11960, partial [Phycisphaerales bacterium]|nr:hypothetical protein [Phycisphaerales bacterium]
VYHYRFDGSAWTQVDELVASPPRFGAQFGVEMSLNDDTLIVGAHLDVSGGRRTGIAYVFEPDPAGRWRQIARLAPESPFRVDGFGAAVASDGERALVGAFAERDASDSRAGAAYFFDLSCTACAADMDFDGDLTLFDYLAFFNAFDAADPIADLDGDGEFTLLDFVAFQDAFDAGCD